MKNPPESPTHFGDEPIIIFLPLGLNFLDQFAIGGSAKEWIETKEAELLGEETKLEQIQKERNELIESINQNVKAPYSLWKMTPTNFSVRDFFFTELLKSGTVVAAGVTNDGKPIILRGTTDGTTWSWAQVAIEPSKYFQTLSFYAFAPLSIKQLKSNVVLMVGRDADANVVVFRSTNDGKSWLLKKMDIAMSSQVIITRINIEELASGTLLSTLRNSDDNDVILRSVDDGKTWESFTLDINHGGSPAISIVDELKSGALLFSSVDKDQMGIILRSDDDGKTWRSVTPDSTHDVAQHSFLHIKQLESGTLLLSIIKNADKVLFSRSTDDGNTWHPVAADAVVNYSGFKQLKSNTVLVVGKNEDGKVVILRSADDGNTWHPVAADAIDNYSGFEQLKSNTVLVAGKNEDGKVVILRSADDGNTWHPVAADAVDNYSGFKQLKSNTVLVAGKNEDGKVVILRSADDGNTWQPIAQDLTFKNITVKQLESGVVLAEVVNFSGNTVILRSIDDGKSWTPIIPEALQARLNMEWLKNDTGLAVSVNRAGKIITYQSDTAVSFLDGNETLAEIKKFIDQNKNIFFMKEYEIQATELLQRYERISKAINDLQNGLQEFKNVAKKNVQGDAWTKQLHLQGTRITVIALLIYLVQIYVNRFRYNMRLSGFYLARADALTILNIEKTGKSPEEFQTIVAAVSPEVMTFGKTETPSTQQMVQVSSDLFKRK